LLPAALGLISGSNSAHPSSSLITRGGLAGSLGGTLVFFLSFFAATALFFVPTRSSAASPGCRARTCRRLRGNPRRPLLLYTGSFHLLSVFLMS
jgi:hypothetical protein